MEEKLQEFKRLLEIMDKLRENCPWDKQQTFESIRPLTIEETYELAEAIMNGNLQEIKKELGDLMLHIVFYSKIGSEFGEFDIKDVLKSINEKLIYRHPHVFGDISVKNSKDVEQNWEQLKLKEKDGNKSILSGIPTALPALVKSHRIQDKARGAGFDWTEKEQVWDKVTEEINELKTEVKNMQTDKMEQEFGDVLFSLVNAARLYGINPENALERTNQKFIKRFNYLEQKVKENNLNLMNMSLEEMDVFWNEAKKFDK
jgi:XTP/dITP diphosphohydrolase